jgi:hypothetical protein
MSPREHRQEDERWARSERLGGESHEPLDVVEQGVYRPFGSSTEVLRER